ncbi:beta-glucosidase [Nocardioides mangrovicus]|uniref:Beta-glucosidase n=1 Tax=Nocardioides mangrovicus TaxID=2478913 RepID=A0A3L8P710_9ACTN|nr:GH1 family beta-glucosidase [Nocardioides mangrovicus]RLV50777.1 beta-glucosidase [Nocardioides mangrovicus]
MTTRRFPEGFEWGMGTAAYQIEGGVHEGGRGPSIWDTFSHTPGAITRGDTGDVACDHYHRLDRDLDLLAELAMPAYRFSVAWPRVMPDGRTLNQDGLDFYARLVDGLLDRGIEPMLTLYHWDLPQALEDVGGWRSRETVDRFADYATLVGKELGDRVGTLTTLNEPWCTAYLGHATGEHAPGLRDPALAYPVAHHLNLAHGRAAAALRSVVPASARLSVTLNLQHVVAASDEQADRDAAEHARVLSNDVFLGPMLRGRYDDAVFEETARLTDWSFVRDGDEAECCVPLDFLGVNYYSPGRVSATPNDDPWPGSRTAFRVRMPELPQTVMAWPVQPSALTELLTDVHREYRVPLVVTENGIAGHDVVDAEHRVRDGHRIDYLRDHLGAVLDAVDAGADVRGYVAWTFLDNFEWAWGYEMRFGLVHVDFDTLVRTPKDSAHWLSDVIARNRLLLPERP